MFCESIVCATVFCRIYSTDRKIWNDRRVFPLIGGMRCEPSGTGSICRAISLLTYLSRVNCSHGPASFCRCLNASCKEKAKDLVNREIDPRNRGNGEDLLPQAPATRYLVYFNISLLTLRLAAAPGGLRYSPLHASDTGPHRRPGRIKGRLRGPHKRLSQTMRWCYAVQRRGIPQRRRAPRVAGQAAREDGGSGADAGCARPRDDF